MPCCKVPLLLLLLLLLLLMLLLTCCNPVPPHHASPPPSTPSPPVHNEYCETPEDFIARRTRLAFLDRRAAQQALPRVVELMAEEKRWSRRRARAELRRALAFLDTFEAPPPPPAAEKAAGKAEAGKAAGEAPAAAKSPTTMASR